MVYLIQQIAYAFIKGFSTPSSKSVPIVLAINMNRIEFQVHKFVIIDLVPDDELQTGRRIEECLLDAIHAEQSSLICERYKCESATEFFTVINNIKADIIERGLFPYIHIEGHGSQKAIHFLNGDLIEWEKVFYEFRSINILCKNNLFFSSGACESAYAYRAAATITQPAPVFGMLAPEIKVAAKCVDGYISFYKSLIRSESIIEAFNAFTKKNNSQHYALIFSQHLFEKAAYKYITEQCMGKGRGDRIEALLSKAVNETGLPVNEARKLIKKNLKDPQGKALKKFHEKFMHYDIYPENADRFPFDAKTFEEKIRKGQLKIN